jgi:hypothetical protein
MLDEQPAITNDIERRKERRLLNLVTMKLRRFLSELELRAEKDFKRPVPYG